MGLWSCAGERGLWQRWGFVWPVSSLAVWFLWDGFFALIHAPAILLLLAHLSVEGTPCSSVLELVLCWEMLFYLLVCRCLLQSSPNVVIQE